MADLKGQKIKDIYSKFLTLGDDGSVEDGDGNNKDDALNLAPRSYVDDKASSLQADIDVIADGQDAGIIGYSDKAEMDADTSQPEKTVGFVGNDPDSSNNGWYRFDGTAWVATDFTTNVVNINSAFVDEGATF